MRNLIDFSSWQGMLSTLLGLVLVTLVAVGIRLLVMQRIQQRRERQNRQINERLKTLIAAYKTLGGSFTGNLAVDPRHLRDLRTHAAAADGAPGEAAPEEGNSERRRRIRDAVEAALSDVVLLGTAEQVRLAVQAANDMVAGRQVETARLHPRGAGAGGRAGRPAHPQAGPGAQPGGGWAGRRRECGRPGRRRWRRPGRRCRHGGWWRPGAGRGPGVAGRGRSSGTGRARTLSSI
jgi:heme exporter protein D